MRASSAASIAGEFSKQFGKSPFLFTAPGRINLLGEHIDYNEGIVMPAAIDKHLVFAVTPNGSDHNHLVAHDLTETASFSLNEIKPGNSWVNYLMGVMDGLQRLGKSLPGVDCVFGGNIPAGAGLSSSAALCCGFGFALNKIFDLGFDRLTLAKVAQHAEHKFAGVNCGIMDQYASLFGEKDSVLMLDCRTLTHELLPMKLATHSLILVDTKVKHTLGDTAYNDRREACEAGVSIVRKKYPEVLSLRDVTRTMLYELQDQLGEEVFIKCLFVEEEIQRVQTAGAALKSNNLAAFGDLMYLAHWGLSQAYEVSCEELDYLVMLAEEDKSVVAGARMMGGGFGGCTINLVKKSEEAPFRDKVWQKYFATFKTEPDFYSIQLSHGVDQIIL
jgi:galactokinase